MSPIIIPSGGSGGGGVPGATFLELQTEFYARGFDYLNNDAAGRTRAKAWINQAYQELCEEDLWPFLLTTGTGAAPLSIPDLRTIHSVTDTAQSIQLAPVDEDELIDDYTTLTSTGSAQFFYITDVTVNTYPVGGTLRVRYWFVPADLVGDSDAAVVPRRFMNLIVDGAVRRAMIDSDDDMGAKRAEDERQRGLLLMRQSLLFRDGRRNYQRVTYASGDW